MSHDCDNCRHVLAREDEEPCVHCINNYVHKDMWEPAEDKVILKRRCKTCKHFFEGNKDIGDVYDGICTRQELDFEVNANDYCSFSEAVDGSKN